MKKAFILTGLCVFIAVNISTSQARIYKWVDEKGVKHFSQSPPANSDVDVQSMHEYKESPEEKAKREQEAERVKRLKAEKARRKAEERRQVEIQQKLQRQQDEIERINAREKTHRTVVKKPKSDHIKNLEKIANQWYENKGRKPSSMISEQRRNRLQDPRRWEAVNARRELNKIYSGSATSQNKSFEKEEDNYGGAINPETGEYYPRAGDGVVNPETGEYYPRTGNGGFINPETGEYYPVTGN